MLVLWRSILVKEALYNHVRPLASTSDINMVPSRSFVTAHFSMAIDVRGIWIRTLILIAGSFHL